MTKKKKVGRPKGSKNKAKKTQKVLSKSKYIKKPKLLGLISPSGESEIVGFDTESEKNEIIIDSIKRSGGRMTLIETVVEHENGEFHIVDALVCND